MIVIVGRSGGGGRVIMIEGLGDIWGSGCGYGYGCGCGNMVSYVVESSSSFGGDHGGDHRGCGCGGHRYHVGSSDIGGRRRRRRRMRMRKRNLRYRLHERR